MIARLGKKLDCSLIRQSFPFSGLSRFAKSGANLLMIKTPSVGLDICQRSCSSMKIVTKLRMSLIMSMLNVFHAFDI